MNVVSAPGYIFEICQVSTDKQLGEEGEPGGNSHGTSRDRAGEKARLFAPLAPSHSADDSAYLSALVPDITSVLTLPTSRHRQESTGVATRGFII